MRRLNVGKMWVSAVLLAVFAGGCGDSDKNPNASNPGDQFSPPTVITETPLAGSVGVCPNTNPLVISAVFSKAMNPATITAAGTFTLAGPGSTTVPGTVTYVVATNTATFTPTALPLAAGVVYTAMISTAATDLFGNRLANPFTWTFTTSPVCGPPPPGLGTACGVGILGATPVVSSVGLTHVTGDVDISPAASITGFTLTGGPGTITGAFHLADGVAAQAQSDLTVAYNNAAAAASTMNLTGIDLGTLAPLPPGVYTFNTSAGLTGTLTLSGPASGVWIFQVGTALTTASASQVVLTGGAVPKNVFWQIGSAATLGTGSTFAGNILANATITLGTGTVLNGRALDRGAAVTMDSNQVNVPSCP